MTFNFSGQILRKRNRSGERRGREGGREKRDKRQREFLILESEYMAQSTIDYLPPDLCLCPFLTYEKMQKAVLLSIVCEAWLL